MLLMGETPPRRSRVRAAADVAAANSGPIGTHGLHSGEDEVHRSSADARTASPLRSPTLCLLTACVRTGCVGHTSVHCDSGSCAWGSGVCARARCVEQQQQQGEGHICYRVWVHLLSGYVS